MLTKLSPLISKYKITLSFSLFCLLFILLLVTSQYVLIDENLYYYSYTDLLNDTEIKNLINYESDNQWVYFAVTAGFFYVKFLVLTLFTLSIAFFINQELEFRNIFLSFIESEYLFFIPIIIKILFFIFVRKDYTIQEIASFSPLSLANIATLNDENFYLTYIFQTLSVFELAYIFFLAYRFSYNLNIDYNIGLRYVFSGYVPALFLWFLIYIFIVNLAS